MSFCNITISVRADLPNIHIVRKDLVLFSRYLIAHLNSLNIHLRFSHHMSLFNLVKSGSHSGRVSVAETPRAQLFSEELINFFETPALLKGFNQFDSRFHWSPSCCRRLDWKIGTYAYLQLRYSQRTEKYCGYRASHPNVCSSCTELDLWAVLNVRSKKRNEKCRDNICSRTNGHNFRSGKKRLEILSVEDTYFSFAFLFHQSLSQ